MAPKSVRASLFRSFFALLALLAGAGTAYAQTQQAGKITFTAQFEIDSSTIETWHSDQAPALDILFYSWGMYTTSSSPVRTGIGESITIPAFNTAEISQLGYTERAALTADDREFWDSRCQEKFPKDTQIRRLGRTLVKITALGGRQEVIIDECETPAGTLVGWFVRFMPFSAGITADYYYTKQ